MEFETEYKENRIWRVCANVGFVLALVLILLFYYINVTPAKKSFVVELGEKVSTDLSDYLVGMEWAVNLSELDLSAVNQNMTGTYTAVVKHGWQTFYYKITIQDTTAPKMSILDKTFFVQQGKEYEPEYFIMSVKDESDTTFLTFSKHGEKENSDTICFEELGDDSIIIKATDVNGNSSERSIKIYVDTPPVLDGIKDYYVVVGTKPDFINDIYAYDEFSGDVTGNVVVDENNLNCDRIGDYEIYYYVEDPFELVTQSSCVVHVMEEDAINKLISTGEINQNEIYVVGICDINNAGSIKSEAVEKQVENVLPSIVNIRIGKETKYSTGGGFIIDITDEYVYIGSNRHVFNNEGNRIIYFYDGTKVPFEVVAMDEKTDMGIAKVDIKDIPAVTLKQLKAVSISKEAWEQIDEKKVKLFLCLIGTDGMEYLRTGYDMDYSRGYRKVSVPVLQVSMRLEPGNSGSALFDYEGNLISLATGQSVSPGRYVHYYTVGAEYLVKLYEQTTGNNLISR